jgi:WD40 repeat protein
MRVGQLKGVDAGRVTFAPDDRTLAVMQSSFVAAQQTQAPATVLLWTPATGRRLTLASHDAVGYAPFSSDGKLLATAGRENAARVWDVATGKVLATLQGHSQRLEDVEFSPRDELVVTASDDGSARVWDARSGELVERFQLGTEVWWAQFSADGRQILAEADSLRTYPCALCGGPSELLGLAARRAPVR